MNVSPLIRVHYNRDSLISVSSTSRRMVAFTSSVVVFIHHLTSTIISRGYLSISPTFQGYRYCYHWAAWQFNGVTFFYFGAPHREYCCWTWKLSRWCGEFRWTRRLDVFARCVWILWGFFPGKIVFPHLSFEVMLSVFILEMWLSSSLTIWESSRNVQYQSSGKYCNT